MEGVARGSSSGEGRVSRLVAWGSRGMGCWPPERRHPSLAQIPNPGLTQKWPGPFPLRGTVGAQRESSTAVSGPAAPRGPFPDVLRHQRKTPSLGPLRAPGPDRLGWTSLPTQRDRSLEPITVYLEKEKKSDISCTCGSDGSKCTPPTNVS